MRRSDDAESRAVHGREPASGEELLEVGRRQRVPRWFWAVATAAAAVVVASVAVTRGGSDHHGRVPPSPSTSRAVLNVPPPVAPALDPPLDVGTGAVLDAVAFGQHTWVLHPDRITGLSIAAGRNKSVAVPRLGSSTVNGSWRLVLDATTARLWVVLEGTERGRALEYTLWTLTRIRDLRLPRINGAAAMDGHLYLTSDRQLIDVRPRAAVHAVPIRGVTGALGPIAADPARSRLLVLDYSAATHLWIYSPDRIRVRKATTLPFTKASIAVTEQAIWVGGFSRTKAMLWQLDIPSLTPSGKSPLSSELGPGAVLLAAGDRDVWVASGGGPGLWCVDAKTGRKEQHWTLAPTVITTDQHRVIAVADGQAVPLHLRGGCTG
ncbi:MAG TPA: hypothetical protein VE441_16065 [Mycobacterium sp.]|nr:hypothetical protein [Mycobacterium sp.]